MCELEIARTVRRFDREDYGSVVYGIMKEGSTILGGFELSIPYRRVEQKAYWINIWDFKVAPEHQRKGFGTACYFALEKMILEKYRPEEIHLRATTPDSKRFWEKLGYTTTHDQGMKKRFGD